MFQICRQTQNLDIHPESVDNVQSTREHLQQGDQSRNSQRARHRNTGELQCPICLGEASYAVETNCGHVFCGKIFPH